MTALDAKALDAKHREATAIWPDVSVTKEQFGEILAEAMAAGGTTLDTIHATDLYLAAGCLAGDGAALLAFERKVMGAVRGAVERASPRGNADDMVQITLEKLLVGPPPKLAQYTGKGPLVGWVRVVAVREALQVLRNTKRDVVASDAEALGTSAASIDMKMLRDMHGPSFTKAVEEAIGRLSVDQRTILRFHARDGLTIDQIAPMLGIHRATAARRLEKARTDVLEHTKAVLREKHGLSDSEARSLCMALGGQLDMSLGKALNDEAIR